MVAQSVNRPLPACATQRVFQNPDRVRVTPDTNADRGVVACGGDDWGRTWSARACPSVSLPLLTSVTTPRTGCGFLRVLTHDRGDGTRTELFDGFPHDVCWQWMAITPAELAWVRPAGDANADHHLAGRCLVHPPVAPDRQRYEDSQQAADPCDGLSQRCRGAKQRERAGGIGGDRD